MEQPQYNMFWRYRVELEYENIYKNIGLGTTIWSPLAGGTLTDKYLNNNTPTDTRMDMHGMQWLKDINMAPERLKKIQKLGKVAQDMGTTLAKLAIAWCVKNPNVSTVILGATKPEQLKETLAALEVVPIITPSVEKRLEAILDNKPAFKIM
jgi:aryl-alcohol dehydrogenase-like predicted oxidoreductase